MCVIEGCNRKDLHVDDFRRTYCSKHGKRFPRINPIPVFVRRYDIYKAHRISIEAEREFNKHGNRVKVIRTNTPFVNGYLPVYDEVMIDYWTSQYYNVNFVQT